MTGDEIKTLFSQFNELTILVIGDVMIDSYVWGKVDRISPEAPVPIVQVSKRENTLGGASNVVKNLHALETKPILCTVIGNDDKADVFIELINTLQIPTTGIIKSNERVTTTKFRVMGNNTQMLRVDEEVTSPLTPSEFKQLTQAIDTILSNQQIDVIIFEDYDKGVISPALIEHVMQQALAKKIPVAVDPKKNNFSHYKHVTLFKPNLKEIQEGLKIEINKADQESLKQAVQPLHNNMSIQMVMTTLSEHGIYISDSLSGEDTLIPAHKRDISDVSGAGDTVISVAACCLALKQPASTIAALSNLAGGLVCEKVGAVPVDKQQLQHEATRVL